MRWKRPAVAVSVAAMLTLAACGGGSDDGSSSGPTATFKEGGGAGQAIDMEQSEGPVADISGATAGGDVRVMSAGGLTTMDPTEAYYVNTASILSGLVVRSLTQYVYVPETNSMTLIPDIASSWKYNADFTEWTFTLREGVKYEDGTDVTCDDMRYGMLRSMDRDSFPGGASYSNEYFEGGKDYKGPITGGSTDFPGITCKGQDITIAMAKPFPDMAYWGAFPAMSPIPEDASDPKDYSQHPLATGPYMFDTFEPGTTLDLVRNDSWDPATDPGRHAYPDSYSMTFADDSSQLDQVILADQGDAQTTLTYDNLLAPDYRTATTDAADRLVLGSSPCTFMWWPDYRKVTDINIRKAIGLAYPYENAWKAGGEIVNVTRIPGTTILPPGIPGRPASADTYDVLGIGGVSTDAAQAKQILTDADALGYEIKFLYITDDPNSVAAKKEIEAGLNEAGFKASPVATTLKQYSALRADPNAPINVRSGGWCSDWPSGGSWMPPLFQSDGSANLAFFDEKAVDDEIARIQGEVAIEDQPAAWYALDQTIEEDYLPAIITGYSGTAMLFGSKISGMNNDDTFGMPTWKDISVVTS